MDGHTSSMDGHTSSMADLKPEISIIVASCDHELFSTLCAAINNQTVDLRRSELIYVKASGKAIDDGELRRCEDLLSDVTRLHVMDIGKGSRGRARNLGIDAASSDLLLFMGDDIIPTPKVVESHLKFHANYPSDNAVGLGAAIFDDELRQDPFRRWLDDSGIQFGVSFTSGTQTVNSDFFYVTNTSIKRSFQERAGKYDERFPFDMHDDHEMGVRMKELGIEVSFLPDAVAIHDHPLTLTERCETMRMAAQSARLYEQLYPERGVLYCQFNRSLAWYRWNAAKKFCHHKLTGSADALGTYYESRLTATFLQSYADSEKFSVR